MRTTIDLDDELLRRTKELAGRSNSTLTAMIEDALREALSRFDKPAGHKKIKLPVSDRPPGVLPGVDLDNSASLLDIMEGRSDTSRR